MKTMHHSSSDVSVTIETKGPELIATLKEVQTTNKFILRRLNQISDRDGEVCTCECHSKDEPKDVKEIKAQVKRLEEENKHRDTTVHRLSQQLREVQETLLRLKDSTLRTAPARSLPNHPTKGILQLKLDRDTDYSFDKHYAESENSPQSNQELNEVTDREDTLQAENLNNTENERQIGAKDDKETVNESGESDDNQNENQISTTDDEESLKEAEESEEDRDRDEGRQCTKTEDDQANAGGKVESEVPVVKTEAEPILVYHVEEPRHEREASSGQAAAAAAAATADTQKGAVDTGATSEASGTGAKSELLDPTLPRVIHQTQKIYKHQLHWELLFSHEMDEAKAQVGELGGVHTVICLDISESMAQDGAWNQARRFFMDYINGLIKMRSVEGITDEHVALVTFGHNTRVKKRFTNKFEDVRTSFESILLGGPSPLYGGLKMAIAAAGSSKKQVCFVNSIKVSSKIVLITDGVPTQQDLVEGPDHLDGGSAEETRNEVLQIMGEIGNYSLDFFCVPVGKANMEFLDLVTAIPNGTHLQYTDGEKFSRRTFLTLKAQPTGDGLLGMMGGGMESHVREYMSKNMPELSSENFVGMSVERGTMDASQFVERLSNMSKEDLEQMKEITERGHIGLEDLLRMSSDKGDKYQESDSEVLPPLGTRVRRGPDWSWNTQDSNGPGTVIGHVAERKHIWVEWDADGHSYFYHYGGGGRYDILPVEEPRQAGDGGKLQVGCVVKPGKDWKDTKTQRFDRGVVLRLLTKDDANVMVRWSNGTRGDYAHNLKGKNEVEFCPPFSDTWTTSQQPKQQQPARRKNKNKNKNAA